MVNRRRVNAFDERKVVHHPSGVGEQLAHPAPATPVLFEFKNGWCHRKATLLAGHPGETLRSSHRLRQILIKTRSQAGLVIPKVDLGWAAIEVDVDHRLRLGFPMGQALQGWVQGIRAGAPRRGVRASVACFSPQMGQRQTAEAQTAFAKKLAPRFQKVPAQKRFHKDM